MVEKIIGYIDTLPTPTAPPLKKEKLISETIFVMILHQLSLITNSFPPVFAVANFRTILNSNGLIPVPGYDNWLIG